MTNDSKDFKQPPECPPSALAASQIPLTTPQPTADKTIGPPASTPKILLVEDNEMNRDMLKRRLERRGYEVVLAFDGREGILAAQTELPDLILMDLSLPEIDGREATRFLKSEPATAGIPLIVLTARATLTDQEQALAAGCDGFATKPVEFEQLLSQIRGLIQKTASISW
jgi:two-component system, cell cycle response regulator DivK